MFAFANPTVSWRPTRAGVWRWIRRTAALLLLMSLSTCSPLVTLAEQVQQLGVLRVATVNSPTTYYVGPAGPTGFEYELADGFARKLGVKLEVVLAANAIEAMDLVRAGKAHLAAAGVAITPIRSQSVRFSRPVLSVVAQLVYREGEKKPDGLDDLDGSLVVGTGSAAAERLATLKPRHRNLAWTETDEFETEELLMQVAQGDIDYTIAPSDLVAINQHYYPSLRVGITLSQAQDIAWAFRPGLDSTLYDQAQKYLSGVRAPELAQLHDRYFGHVEQVDNMGAVALAGHVETRLPQYRSIFEKAANSFGLDWRLLAAIGYQESHWDSTAVSPTGVKGIMQLTQQTAAFMKIADREDPAQSIAGGARYLRQLIDQIPDEIPDPDRTWLALAAYNMGWGHLIDAQSLTSERGGDPKRWFDVRSSLPLLTQARWYKQTKFGYARGHEAETYVGNVRTYYGMLVYMFGGTPKPPEREPPKAPALPQKEPLNIRAPVL